MRQIVFLLAFALVLSGCALFQPQQDVRGARLSPAQPAPVAEVVPTTGSAALGAVALRAEALDKTSAAEKAAALAAPAKGAERELGKVVVALGPPAEQGIWLSTSLVKEMAQGRIVTAAGKSLAVELRPGTGGALLSLAGFQALGLGLTSLPEVTVYGP
ncbi:MAG: hypothetical protein ACK4FR_03590 [Tabrizicola sp.]